MTTQSPNSHFDTSSEAQSRRAKRRHGTRAILSEQLFKDLVVAWEEQGVPALARMAFHDPSGFVNMVARLMPQKIEHTTPTDGMTDDRLAQLIDLAEAAIEARRLGLEPPPLNVTPAHRLTHENAGQVASPEEGGGGPDASVDAAGGGSTSTSRDAIAENPPENPNKLKDVTPHDTSAERVTEKPKSEHVEDPNKLKAAEPTEATSVYDDRTPVTPFSSSHDIPHPVGRPFPKADHDVSRSNRQALDQNDDPGYAELTAAEEVDPESLF